MCDPSYIDAEFIPIATSSIVFILPWFFISSNGIVSPFAVKNSTTSREPLVIVPVLSLNKIFKEPAVSIPTAFLTNTLCSNIFLVFCINTKEIMSGSPSGTAQTIITIARETASTKSCTIFVQPVAK